jgi:hypothetical protein
MNNYHRIGKPTTIGALMAQRARLKAIDLTNADDATLNEIVPQIGDLEDRILAAPSLSAEDLAAKFSVWLWLVEDPPSILDKHVEQFRRLWCDICVEAQIDVSLGAMAEHFKAQ